MEKLKHKKQSPYTKKNRELQQASLQIENMRATIKKQKIKIRKLKRSVPKHQALKEFGINLAVMAVGTLLLYFCAV